MPQPLTFPLEMVPPRRVNFRLNEKGRVVLSCPEDVNNLTFTKQEHRQLRDFLTAVLREDRRKSFRKTSRKSSRRTRSTAR